MTDLKLIKIALDFLKPYWRQVLLILILLPLTAFCYSMQPLIIQRAIDGPLAKLDIHGLQFYVLALIAFVVLNFTLQVLQFRVMNFLGQTLVAHIRTELFVHLEYLSMSFFDRTPVGRSVSRLTSDIEQLAESFAGGLVLLALDVFNILGILVCMFYLNWKLSLALLVFLLPIYWVTDYFQELYRKSNLEARKQLANLNSILQQNIIGIPVIHLSNSAEKNKAKFAEKNTSYFKANDISIKADAQLTAAIELLSLIALAAMIYLSSNLIEYGLSIGVVIAFLQYSQTLFDPIRNLSERFTVIQSAMTGLERMQELLDEPIMIKDPVVQELHHIDISSKNNIPLVEFNKVSFRYNHDSNWILKDFDLQVFKGQRVGIKGKTGSGKTTLAKLLTRLYEADEGLVKFNGVDIKQIKQESLRQAIAIVHQDIYIFAGDLAANISLGKDVDWDRIQPILEHTSCTLESNLSERGLNISAGEQQLINLARALVLDPQLLILDEATAKIDPHSEASIEQLLDDFMAKGDKTLMIIAHRPNSLKKCDLVIDFDN